MHEETMNEINRLANARHELYRKAGRGQATAEDLAQIDRMTGQLATLWDQHRREYASGHRDERNPYHQAA